MVVGFHVTGSLCRVVLPVEFQAASVLVVAKESLLYNLTRGSSAILT